MSNLQTKNNTEYSGLEELINTEVMKNYNQSIVAKSVKSSNSLNQVVDFGAGIGTLSLIFKQTYGVDALCVEIDDENKKYLSKRKLNHVNTLHEIDGNVDLIFSSNVLEHIEDDVSVLGNMKEKLNKNGEIYLYLPAKMLLWSRLDEEVGHYRRYELSELRRKCEQVGLKIHILHYADSVGFFASLLMKVVGYNSESGIGSVKSLKFYDKWIFPISKILDNIGFKYLFGKNLILLAKKAD